MLNTMEMTIKKKYRKFNQVVGSPRGREYAMLIS